LLDLAYRTVDSAVGTLLLAATPRGLVRVAFANEGHDNVLLTLSQRISPRMLEAPSRLDPVARQLDEYFTGRRHSFDVALDWSLSQGFRRTVLEHLNTDISYGATASYAAWLNCPAPLRRYGLSARVRDQPDPIVVPCTG